MKKTDFLSNKFHLFILAIVVLIGILIRFWALGGKSLWIDEIYTDLFVNQKTFFESFVFMSADLSPPIYYLILYAWVKFFGNSEFMLRLPSVLAGIAAIIVIYIYSNKLFNRQIASFVTILTAFSPVMLYYSQEARPYSLFALFSIITTFIWIELINQTNNDDSEENLLKKYTIFSLITVFTHYWGIILIFFQVLYLFVLYLSKKLELINLIITSINIFLVSVIFISIHYSVLNKYKILMNTTIYRVNTLNSFEIIFNNIFYDNYIFPIIITIFLLINFNNLKNFFTREIIENKLTSPLIYLPWIIILPVTMYFILDKSTSYLHPRHIIFIIPTIYLLISNIIHGDGKYLVLKQYFILAISFIFLGIYLFIPQKNGDRYFTYYNNPKQEWKESTNYLLNQPKNNALIIIDRHEDMYSYYLKEFNENTIFENDLFNRQTISQKINDYRKKYKKIYIFSTSMLGVDNIEKCMKSVKCDNLVKKEFVNVNFYECE